MAFPISTTIYGCDTDNDGTTDVSGQKTPLKTDVQALSGVVSTGISVAAIDIEPMLETEKIEYFGNLILNIKRLRIKLNPEGVYKDFPSTGTTFATFYGSDVLKMRFLWIDLDNYTILPYAAGTILAVNLTGISVTHEHKLGKKKIFYEFEATQDE